MLLILLAWGRVPTGLALQEHESTFISIMVQQFMIFHLFSLTTLVFTFVNSKTRTLFLEMLDIIFIAIFVFDEVVYLKFLHDRILLYGSRVYCL
jgi:hypothetical protein